MIYLPWPTSMDDWTRRLINHRYDVERRELEATYRDKANNLSRERNDRLDRLEWEARQRNHE